MKNEPSVMLLMKELQNLRSEMLELKSLSIKQTELLEKMGTTAVEEILPTVSETEPTHSIINFDYKISTLLQELRIPPNVKGYAMLRESIKAVYQDDNMLRVTKYLYPMLAKKFSTTAARAERAIRHAIEISYSKNYLHPLYQRGYVDYKPSNSQFIAMLVEHFKLEEEGKKVVPFAQ